MTDYHPRAIASQIRAALGDMPVVVVTGMRQTGKSTFLQQQKELQGRRYITFDDFEYLEAAKQDPASFLQEEIRSHQFLSIDEAQKCPEMLTAIKRIVDREKRPGQFLLSGSSNFALIKGVTETLAGRSVYFTMHPFTRREADRKTQGKSFLKSFWEKGEIPKVKNFRPIEAENIRSGGMPSVCLGKVKNENIWFKGFEQTYLERDVRDLSQVGNIMLFRSLLRLAALRTGQILSVSQLGRDARLNSATTSRYLSLLEASFIAYRLYPYLNNRASRLVKAPKLYFTDSGLASFLIGTDYGKGALFETYIAQNIVGIIDAEVPDAKVYFWNVQGRHEVDFVIEKGSRCIAIEAKDKKRWDAGDLSGLKAFIEATPQCIAGILAYNGTEAVKLGEKIWAAPAGMVIS